MHTSTHRHCQPVFSPPVYDAAATAAAAPVVVFVDDDVDAAAAAANAATLSSLHPSLSHSLSLVRTV